MDYAYLRKRMVDEQLIPRGISSQRILDTFLKVERHKFLAEEFRSNSYSDFPISIGEGQTISQPFIVALMTESLKLTGTEKILEIGTGSGYQTAILAELAKEVYSIERSNNLAQKASLLLHSLGYKNIYIKTGDGTLGWSLKAPFDRIIIAAAAPRIPLPLGEQLAEKGIMVLPIGDSFSQNLTIVEKINGNLTEKEICSCMFVPLIGKYGNNLA